MKKERQEKQEYWSLIKEVLGVKPNAVNAQVTIATERYKTILLNVVKGRFEIETNQSDWSEDFILDLLLLKGRFFITDVTPGLKNGDDKEVPVSEVIFPLDGSPFGLNVFSRYTSVTITNPVLLEFERILTGAEKNAIMYYLYDDKGEETIVPLLNMYAEKLASIECAMDVNLFNTRLAYIFNCDDTAQADTAKMVYDKITQGEPAIFTKVKTALSPDDGGIEVTTLPVKEIYIYNELVEAKRAVMSDFLSELGLNSVSYEKKERLITDEVNSNNDEANVKVERIKRNLDKCNKAVSKMFPSIQFKISLKEGDISYGKEKKTDDNVHKENSE